MTADPVGTGTYIPLLIPTFLIAGESPRRPVEICPAKGAPVVRRALQSTTGLGCHYPPEDMRPHPPAHIGPYGRPLGSDEIAHIAGYGRKKPSAPHQSSTACPR
jgi:hypothetical protein